MLLLVHILILFKLSMLKYKLEITYQRAILEKNKYNIIKASIQTRIS